MTDKKTGHLVTKRNTFGKGARIADYAHGWKHGAGGYKSDILDFASWAAGLINGKLMKGKSSRQAWTRQKLSSGKTTDCGLGFFIRGEESSLEVSHGGSQTEARSHMVIFPRQKWGRSSSEQYRPCQDPRHYFGRPKSI